MHTHIKNIFSRLHPHVKTIIIEPLVGGLSVEREKFKCTVDGICYVTIFLRAPFDQCKQEIEAHLLAASIGSAPKIHYYNDDYSMVVMDFIDDSTLLLEEAALSSILLNIARTCYTMSKLQGFLAHNNIFSRIDIWADQVLEQKTKVSDLVLRVMKQVKLLKQKIEFENRPLVFSHGDLHPRNIFFSQGQLYYVDWEDAGISYEFLDLASFSVCFCLDDNADRYLLTSYLQDGVALIEQDIYYFQLLKLVIRAAEIIGYLTWIENLPLYANNLLPPQGDYKYYAQLFANKKVIVNESELLYNMSLSQAKEFFNMIDRVLSHSS